jgi:methionyl-tRNA formyltransferase
MKTICLAGKNEIAVNALYYLLEHFPDFSYCVVPNKTDPGYTTWQPSLRFHAKKLGIPIRSLEEVYPIPDLIFLSLEFDALIKPHLFQTSHLFNIHFSALPKYKGMFTSVMPILHGETESGVTLHKIDPGIDTGDILDQILFPLLPHSTGRDLYGLYLSHSFELLKRNLDPIFNGTFSTRIQPVEGASYYSRKAIDFSDLPIDLNKTAFEVANQFRAFQFRDYQMPVFQEWEICGTEYTKTKSEGKPGRLVNETELYFEITTIDFNLKLQKDYYKPFWEACSKGNLQDVKRIFPFIPDVDLRNKLGWNGLILAVYNGSGPVAEFLLANGARKNGTNYKGTTITMYGLGRYEKFGDDSMLRFMMDQKPDLAARDELGLTLMDYARDEHARNLIALGLTLPQ